MELRAAKQSDLDYLAEHSVSKGCFREQPQTIDYVYALEHEGNILGVGGVKILNPTTAWVWVDMSEHALNHTIIAYRVIHQWLTAFMEEKGVTRLMAAIDVGFPEGIRMAEHLDFYKESTMRNFIGRKDAYMFVRLNERVE